MRYIADSSGYVKEVSFGADIVCDGQVCTEYTGAVPTGYASLEAWFMEELEKLYRWKIVDGNLTLDSSAVAPSDPTPLTPEEELARLGGISRTLLWQNAALSTGFGAQTIGLDLNGYDFVDIESIMTASSPLRKTFRVAITDDSVPMVADFTYGTASKIVCWYRAAYVEKASGVRFMGAWQSNTTADTSMNTAAIPFRIYGGKGGVN